jgi:hypothetical protein
MPFVIERGPLAGTMTDVAEPARTVALFARRAAGSLAKLVHDGNDPARVCVPVVADSATKVFDTQLAPTNIMTTELAATQVARLIMVPPNRSPRR